jgi:hypothetical protein
MVNKKKNLLSVDRRFLFIVTSILLLTLYSGYTWENLTLDSLEQSTTTSRDVRYLVGQTELVDTSYRVATTNQ